jgi:hypothetical protein
MKVDLKKTVASALSFAHLAGIGGKAAAKGRAEDDDEKDKAESDDKDTDAKGSRAEGDEKDTPEDDDKKGSKAGADDDYDAEEDDSEKDDKDKKSKKSKASDDDGDDDKDDKTKAGAKQERARWASLMANPAVTRNLAFAVELAATTDFSAERIVSLVAKVPAGAATNNTARSARNPSVGAGGGAEPNSKQKVDASWDSAFKKANPRR